ncbi:MAG: TfoX/Sxy family protein [Anaerolineaceae bacterium]|nr:MAG: RNA methyltransferase [Chloroflexi bacterium HGW-Chloroflexi-7]
MAFDAKLANRVYLTLKNEDIVEKKMFGGIGFLLNGNMVCGVHEDNLIVRVGKERYAEILVMPHVKPFDLTGTALTGWVEVTPAGTRIDQELADWVRLGVEFVQGLPPKNKYLIH